MTLEQEAKAQEDAAAHCRSVGLNYLASRHEALARYLAAAAKRKAELATGRAEAS